MDAPVKVEPPPIVPPETEEQRARAREALKGGPLWRRSQGFSGPRPVMITLERLKEVLSYDPYSGEFTWKDMHRRYKSTGGLLWRGY